MSSDDPILPTHAETPDSDAPPARRDMKDLIGAVRGVTKKLLPDVLTEVKASNALARGNQLVLRILGIFLALVITLLAGCVWALWELSMQVRVTQYEVAGCGDKLDEVKERSKETAEDVEEVKTKAEELAVETAKQPKVEIVPEQDPVKARRAPLKVRVTQPHPVPRPAPAPPFTMTPPPPPAPPASDVVIEAPIFVKDAEVVPSSGPADAPPAPQEKK